VKIDSENDQGFESKPRRGLKKGSAVCRWKIDGDRLTKEGSLPEKDGIDATRDRFEDNEQEEDDPCVGLDPCVGFGPCVVPKQRRSVSP